MTLGLKEQMMLLDLRAGLNVALRLKGRIKWGSKALGQDQILLYDFRAVLIIALEYRT